MKKSHTAVCDADDCPAHDKATGARQSTNVVQTGRFIHEGVRLIWRRRRCAECRQTSKTVEVPLSMAQSLFKTAFSKLY